MIPRDAFGRLIADPRTLDRAERIAEVRRVAGRLQADVDRGSRWFGSALLDWLHVGGDLADRLAIRPEQGSHRTVAAMLRQERQDAALLRLASAVGCDRLALRVLRGEVESAPEHRHLVDAAREAQAPSGPHAISRARRRDRQRGMTRSTK
ncbi:MAG: hypothetical protein KF822_12695 [Steroidobacteraceae bacterium]|nr:hypothetical protein [Steroidobacteraceae bacterium]